MHTTLDNMAEQMLDLVPVAQRLCATLFKVTPIKSFEYFEVDDAGTIKQIHSDGELFHQLLSKRDLRTMLDKFLAVHDTEGNNIYAFNSLDPDYQALAEVYRDNQLEHLLVNSVREVREGRTILRVAIYACPTGPKEINSFYVNNILFLSKFAEYFSLIIEPIFRDMTALPINSDIALSCIQKIRTMTSASVFNNVRQYVYHSSETPSHELPLSARQRVIMALFALGFSAEQTAQHLVISRRTVERHFETLRHKFSCQSKYQLLHQLSQGERGESICLKILLNSRDLNMANLLLRDKLTVSSETMLKQARQVEATEAA